MAAATRIQPGPLTRSRTVNATDVPARNNNDAELAGNTVRWLSLPQCRRSSVAVDLTASSTLFHTEAGYDDESTVLWPNQGIARRLNCTPPEELHRRESLCGRTYWHWSMSATRSLRSAPEASGRRRAVPLGRAFDLPRTCDSRRRWRRPRPSHRAR